MSPVFRHGRLRLYLLKLLDEAPRHGYEVIRLLQDRFMGIYAPSPGTIYPRLARLEEDGLVTHEEVDGKKVYSITDKGREEIRARLDDLADLEDELTESLRDVAREISVDVRETVRNIREELASAAKQFRGPERDATEPADEPDGSSASGSAESRRIREEARRTREQIRANLRREGQGGRAGDWGNWSDWAGRGQGARRGYSGPNPFGDLERMAMQFATELRAAAKQTGNLGERSLNELRDILTDTLAKVRTEVFTEGSARPDREPEHPTPEPPDKSAKS
ncbi:MAG: PadR family transcriptional regulator [Actinobacteria bacterium]|nr:PadR family transcriptional regulator [Actinomycetota bacterium]